MTNAWSKRIAAIALLFVHSPALAQDSQLPCTLECAAIEGRPALPIEYELCGLDKQLHAAADDNRIVTALVADLNNRLQTLGEPGKPTSCWVGKIAAGDAGRKVDFVLPKLTPDAEKSKFSRPQQSMGETGFGAFAVRVCLYGGVKGHRTLTDDAMDLIVGVRSASERKMHRLVSRAAEITDDYAWLEPAAHAQTKPGQTNAQGIQAFEAYLVKLYGVLKDECAANHDANAAYVLGQLLHAIQDLATHAGITNRQHSWLMWQKQNPDADGDRLALAATWSASLLAAVSGVPSLNTCLARINTVKLSADALSASRQVLNHVNEDFTKTELSLYVAQGFLPKTVIKPWWELRDSEAEKTAFFNKHVLERLGLQ